MKCHHVILFTGVFTVHFSPSATQFSHFGVLHLYKYAITRNVLGLSKAAKFIKYTPLFIRD